MKTLSLKQKTTISFIIDCLIIMSTALIMIRYFTKSNPTGPLGETTSGIHSLRAFTNESNIWSAIVSLIAIIANLKTHKIKKQKTTNWIVILRLIVTTSVFLTLTIVVIFLNPLWFCKTGEILRLFQNEMFYTHLIGPLLAIINFIFFTPTEQQITLKSISLCLAPVSIYGIIYALNVLNNIWPDFYNFTFGGHYFLIPIVSIIILAITFGLGKLLTILKNQNQSINN